MLFLILSPVMLQVAATETPEEKGLAIAREADRRDTGFGDFTANMQMILMNKQGQKSERKLRVRTLEVEGDGFLEFHSQNGG